MSNKSENYVFFKSVGYFRFLMGLRWLLKCQVGSWIRPIFHRVEISKDK